MLLPSDPRDLAVTVLHTPAQTSIVLYDNYPGGVGQSEPLFRRREELLRAAWGLASSCECAAGCPSCVGPQDEIGPRGKEGAVRVLGKLTASGSGS